MNKSKMGGDYWTRIESIDIKINKNKDDDNNKIEGEEKEMK